jgi:hypothetical protein
LNINPFLKSFFVFFYLERAENFTFFSSKKATTYPKNIKYSFCQLKSYRIRIPFMETERELIWIQCHGNRNDQ